MREVVFDEAMTKAELACAEHLASFLGMQVYTGMNHGNPDCGVFNMGYMYTGANNSFRAKAFHFRASLELFNRNREELQRIVMRLLRHYPINADCDADNALRTTSNVMVFRLPVEQQAVTTIQYTDIQTRKDAKPIMTFACAVSFDVVFRADFD